MRGRSLNQRSPTECVCVCVERCAVEVICGNVWCVCVERCAVEVICGNVLCVCREVCCGGYLW